MPNMAMATEVQEFLRRYKEANATHVRNIGRIEVIRVEEAVRYKREMSLIEAEIDAYVKSLTYSTLEETKIPKLTLPREANLTEEEKCHCSKCDPTHPSNLVAYKNGAEISHDQFRREMLGRRAIPWSQQEEFRKSGSSTEKPSTPPD